MTLKSFSKEPYFYPFIAFICVGFFLGLMAFFGEMQIQSDFADMENNWSCSELLDFIINVEETDSFVHTEKAIKVWVAHECYN